MRKNIFIKSVLRQPVRAFILSILIGAAAFALVARVTEFIIVRNEIVRIEGLYRAVGVLSPVRFTDFTNHHDVTRAMEIVEGNRHVAISDARRFTQGVMHDRHNLAAQFRHHYFHPTLNDVDIPLLEHYFVGRMIVPPRLLPGAGPLTIIVHLDVDRLITGDPTTLREGEITFHNEHGQTMTLRSRHSMRLRITEEEAYLFLQGLWHPLPGAQLGEELLFRVAPVVGVNWHPAERWEGIMWFLRPLAGEDGMLLYMTPGSSIYEPRFHLNPDERSQPTELVFHIPVADEPAFNAALAAHEDRITLLDENLSSMLVIETQDMSAMPRFMDTRLTRLLDSPLFPPGRWLTYEDYGRPVAVLPVQLAVRRGLHVGETFTITLRNNPRPPWIDTPSDSLWTRGVENWWDNHPQGWWAMTYGGHADWQTFETYELELEVVGTYWFMPPDFTNFTAAEIYIPAGLIPPGFGWDMPQLTGMYSFVLDTPRSEEAFLRQTRSALAQIGFTAAFIPTRFDVLAATTDPVRFSITVNLAVFGAASFLIFFFVVFIYIRQWRRSVAIAQALGTPPRVVLRQLFMPVVLLWVPAVVAGSVIAWFFALTQAENALAVFDGYGAEALLSGYWLAVFCAAIIALILLCVYTAGYTIVRRPVLEQLQGNTQRRQKSEKVVPSGEVPKDFAIRTIELEPLVTRARASHAAAWRHSWRHITRMPLKTALILVLSLLLVFSLGWLNDTIILTEAEIERLWNETVIEAEIFLDLEHEDPLMWPAVISPAVWEVIYFSGFLHESYVESVWYDLWGFSDIVDWGVSHLRGVIAENTRTVLDAHMGVVCDDMQIEFLPGFSEADFVFDPDDFYAVMPIVVRRGMEDREWYTSIFDSDYGAIIGMTNQTPTGDIVYIREGRWRTIYMQVIAVFDGGLERAINRFGSTAPVRIMPLSAHRLMHAGVQPFAVEQWWRADTINTHYPTLLTAQFAIDTSFNRQIDDVREQIENFIRENHLGGMGNVPLTLFMDDSVITDVVLPMEQNLSLLRVLYPILIAVAFVLAVGLSLLAMLQNMKNAAIMRVLGAPRAKTQTSLCIEALIVFVSGVALGLIGLAVFGVALGAVPFYLAGLYLGGAALGSVIGAIVVSMKSPLELLQVRE